MANQRHSMDKIAAQKLSGIIQSLNQPRKKGSEFRFWSTIREALDENKNKPRKEMLFMGIPDGPSLTFFVGPAKSGKTIFLENLGYALAGSSGTFIGHSIPKSKKVLFISLEEFVDRRTDRNRKQLEAMKSSGINITEIESNYFVVNDLFPRYLGSKSECTKLTEVMTQVNPDVLIIDSFSRMYQGAIEQSEKAQSVIQTLKNFSDDNGIPVIVVHHTTKLYERIITIDSMAGSRFLQQEADAVIGIGKLKGGLRYVKPLIYRYADDTVEEMPVFSIGASAVAKYEGNKSEEELLSINDKRRVSANKDSILQYLISKNTVDTAELSNKFVSTNKMSRSTLFYNLRKLEEDGLISQTSHGQYQAYQEEE